MIFFPYKLNPTKFLLFLVSKKKESLSVLNGVLSYGEERERDFNVIGISQTRDTAESCEERE